MKISLLINSLSVLLLASMQTVANEDTEKILEQHLDAARQMLVDMRPEEALANSVNPVIAYYENQYSNEPRRVYCARTPAEAQAYIAEANSAKHEAVILGPQYSEAHCLKYYVLRALKQPAESRSNLIKALELSPLNADFLNESAYLYQREKNWEESRKEFVRAADCARKYSSEEVRLSELSRALRGQGYCLVELGELDEAEAIYLECLKVDPNDQIAMEELEYTQDQKIFTAIPVRPVLMEELAMFNALSPLGGLGNVVQTAIAYDVGEVEAITATAEEGDASASFQLGLIYGNGFGVPRDYAEAVKWFRLAAGQGHARAEYALGVMHAEGLGMPIDASAAAKYFRQSAEQGDSRGEFGLGLAYAEGIDVPQNYDEAAKWFHKSAKQGDAGAQHNLGVLPFRGDGVNSESVEWFQWHLKAAKQGNSKAQTIIGYLYASGTHFAKDPIESAKWYRLAADQGEPFAQSKLGWAYASGEGVLQDYAEAAKWLRKAAEKGQVGAQCNLGALYCGGYGVPPDYGEALKWYQKAADQGSGEAMLFIGVLYSRGDGVQQDYSEAIKWYRKAAEHGSTDALYEVALMYYNGDGVPQNEGRSLRWIQSAAKRGHAKAQKVIQAMNEN